MSNTPTQDKALDFAAKAVERGLPVREVIVRGGEYRLILGGVEVDDYDLVEMKR